MFRKIQSRLEIKILLLIVIVLLVGFGSYVIISSQNETRALMDRQQEMLRASSASLMAGVRTVMLTGKAPFAVEMVNEIRQRVPNVEVTIFDRFGREVFLREGEGIGSGPADSTVLGVLEHGQVRMTASEESGSTLHTRFEPLLNDPACWRCHGTTAAIRGVLQTGLRPSAANLHAAPKPEQELARMLGNTIAAAFRTIMLGGNGEQMDTLLQQARSIPGVTQVQVYGRDGFLHFGPESYEIPDNKIRSYTKERTTEAGFEVASHNTLRLFVPLVNEDRCQVCHGTKFPMRGVLTVEFNRRELRKIVKQSDVQLPMVLQRAVSEGFRSIMLVGRANSVRFYMDELRAMPVYQTLRVFDALGVERFLNPPPRSLHARQVTEGRDTAEYADVIDGEPFLVRAVPIMNEQRCYVCHTSNQKVRGVVEVRSSLATLYAEIRNKQIRSVVVGVLTILLVWLVIRFFMRTVVVRPVQLIEGVAARVGLGDFTARAAVDSIDEIGNLARKINDMVAGLRERFQLQKFVSQQTVNAIRQDAEGAGVSARRIEATVFFSDIRGFTSYSERTAPERVIAMLNACLSQQAAVIKAHGGDIDNYVGDEVFAVFEGEGMVERAVRAAMEIQQRVIASLDEADRASISIGIGINTGEMVMGEMGSEDRKALTVIGDNVNLGARLCGAASSGQILLSAAAAAHVRGATAFRLRALPPIQVKGKKAPVRIYEALPPAVPQRPRRKSRK